MHGWRRAPDMKEVHDDVRTGQKPADTANRLDRVARCRRKINRHQCTPELNIAADLADKTARPWCNEQCRDRRAAGYGFRHGSPQPMLKAITAVGREHDKVARMLAQESDNALRRFLPFDVTIVNLDAKLVRNHPWRVIFFRQPPLREQASRSGNANASPVSCSETCRRCNLLLVAKAMRNACAKATPLKSEKSVGCRIERMLIGNHSDARDRPRSAGPFMRAWTRVTGRHAYGHSAC